MYSSESALVDDFVQRLVDQSSPWGEVRHGREFYFQRGRADVVALSDDGTVIAFEAKLSRWREALHQAYRNLCFAHRSYVVLPPATAKIAAKHVEEFSDRCVGLCYIEGNALVILREAIDNEPLQPWLRDQAALYASGSE